MSLLDSIKNFFSIQEFKEFSFEEIRKFTNLNSAEAIQKTLKGKNVYLVGYHLFDQISNHYLGDLREIETIENPADTMFAQFVFFTFYGCL